MHVYAYVCARGEVVAHDSGLSKQVPLYFSACLN